MADGSTDYMVVARRYRPQTFTDVIGQEHVETALSNAISSGRIGHAYLFTGARGVGKTSTARILAKALNCVNGPTTQPCGECESCKAIAAGDDPDVLEIDGASNRGIDEIRALRQGANIRPTRSRFKIYIIDEVHMLTREAFNALLKTLEEPPAHVKFIFCTTEPTKIPITILSRCQRFDFAGIRTDQIAQRLKSIIIQEGATAEEDAVELLARRAAGSMRDGQSLLEQLLAFAPDHITVADVHSVLGTADEEFMLKILYNLSQKNALAVLTAFDEAMSQGRDSAIFLEQLCGYFRDLMVILSGGTKAQFLYTSPNQEGMMREAGKSIGIQTVLAALQILDHTLDRMRFTTLGRILAELALTRIAHLCDLDAIADVIVSLRSEKREARSETTQSGVRTIPSGTPPLTSRFSPLASQPPQQPPIGRTIRIPSGFAGANVPPEMSGDMEGGNGAKRNYAFDTVETNQVARNKNMGPQDNMHPQPQNNPNLATRNSQLATNPQPQPPFIDPNRALGGGLGGVFAPRVDRNRGPESVEKGLGNQGTKGPGLSSPIPSVPQSPSPQEKGLGNQGTKGPESVEKGPRDQGTKEPENVTLGPSVPGSPINPNLATRNSQLATIDQFNTILESFLEGIMLDNAKSFKTVTMVGTNTLEISYDWEHSFGCKYWDNQDNFARLQTAINRHFGTNMIVEIKQLPNTNHGPSHEEMRRAQSKFVNEVSKRPAVMEIMRLFKTDIRTVFSEPYPLPEFKSQGESPNDTINESEN